MNRRSIFSLLLLMIVTHYSFSQTNEEEREKQMEQVIESIAESEESDIDNSVILDNLTTSAEHQININLASEEELEQLNMLDFRQIQNIINYRKQYGPIVSKYELAAVEGFTPEFVISLNPFITFKVPADSTGYSHRGLYQRIMLRAKSSLPTAKGYHASSESKGAVYPGLPLSFYTRYHAEIPGKIEFGFLTDNDAGEHFFKGSNKSGFDFYSGFISLKSSKFLHQVTLGDFMLRFGQGVNFGAGSGLGKSSNTLGIMRFGQSVRPSTSTDENGFLRGISAILGSGPFKLTLFYSNKNRDANILTDSETGNRYFTSLQTSGYHRTSFEIEDEKSLNEQLAGGYGELKFNRFRMGALMAYQRFNLPMSTGTSAYKAKSFSGNENINLGVDYQLALPRFQFFGEAGLSKNGKPAGVQGLVWHAHPQLSWSAYFRYFDPGFQAFYGNSLTEGSGNRNEAGLYSGVMITPFPKVRVFSYVDIYHFPWLTYSTIAPSTGSDYMAQIDISISRKLSCYVKGKYEAKPQKLSGSKGVVTDYDEKTTKLRLHGEYIINERLTLRSRFEYAGYSYYDVKEKGYLLLQDIIYSPFRQLKMWFRYAWFNTEGYNSRIYTYENDLLYSFSIPEFHGTGQRIYLNLKWSRNSRISAYLKAGLTIHNGVTSWGSGNDLTAGNKRTELRALLYIRF